MEDIFAEAYALQASQCWQAAEARYRHGIDNDRDRRARLGLGVVCKQQGKYEEAIACFKTVLQEDDRDISADFNLGKVFEEIGDFSAAKTHYERAIAKMQYEEKAIALPPNSSEPVAVRLHLGALQTSLGELSDAKETYQKIVAIAPEDRRSYLELGRLSLCEQKIDEAIAFYFKALEKKPQCPEILQNLGTAFAAKGDSARSQLYLGFSAYRRGDFSKALESFRTYLHDNEGDIRLHLALADCYQKLDRCELARTAYENLLEKYPDAREIYPPFLLALRQEGQLNNAINRVKEALKKFPEDISLQLESLRVFPILYKTEADIAFYRRRFRREAGRLRGMDLSGCEREALQAIGWQTNFYLPYAGYNARALQQAYGRFVFRTMAANFPEWTATRSPAPVPKGKKIRIGYLSSCLRSHTVGLLFLGWLRHADSDRFEIFCYDIAPAEDNINQLYQLYADRYFASEKIAQTAEKIVADDLQVLVFLDIGLHPKMTQLAGLRLAPVQCAAWGHPIASGSPTIDYFFAPDCMEPEDGEEHYTEQLVRLPGIGICYPQPSIPPLEKTRADFHLEPDAIAYLCCQSAFKYLPQHDDLFVAIAREVPNAQFLFVEHANPAIARQFHERLQSAFERAEMAIEKYCIFVPRQDSFSYWNLCALADVFLDTFGFSGFSTALDAIACGLPIVTCPGKVMRARQSAGILKLLGIGETIAKDEEDYLRIAVRLGSDAAWRQEIGNTLREKGDRIFENREGIFALEAFFERICRTAVKFA